MHDPPRSLSPYALLGVMWCIWTLVFVFRVLLSPLLPLIEQEYGITHGQSSLLITAMSLTYATVHLPAGMLAVRFGLQRTITTALLLSALCAVLVFLAPDFWWLALTVSMLGLSLGMYFPSAISLLSRVFPPGRVGRVIGLHETASQTGLVVGSLAAGALAPLLGWQELFLACAVPGVVLAAVFAYASRRTRAQPEPKAQAEPIPKLASGQLRTVFSSGEMRRQLVPYTMNVLVAHGLSAMLPLFFVEVHGLDVAAAAYVYALSRVGSIAGSYAGGVISDRAGRRFTQAAMLALTTLSCLALIILPWGAALVGVTLVFSFSSLAYYIATFAELSESLAPQLRSVGVGLFGAVGGVISGFSPLAVGMLADLWGFRVAFLLPTAFAATGLAFLLAGRMRRPGE